MKIEPSFAGLRRGRQEQTELTEKDYLPKPPKKFSDKEVSVFSVTSC